MSDGPRKAVYFFCDRADLDPAARHILAALREELDFEEEDVVVDGAPVLVHRGSDGRTVRAVRTADVLSHDYDRYLPILNRCFADADLAAVVNWHEGANAPERILCAHTTGDVITGHWGPADPVLFRSLVLALEEARREVGLDDFTVLTEATHWSGVPYDGDPALIPRYPVPVVDVEIGSEPSSWSHPGAARAVALALTRVFDHLHPDARSLLCVGGVQFERSFGEVVLGTPPERAVAVSHILANQWVTNSDYDTEAGLAKLRACVDSIRGGVSGIVFHDNLKGPFKQQLRALGEELGVPAFKHKKLRSPDDLPV